VIVSSHHSPLIHLPLFIRTVHVSGILFYSRKYPTIQRG
jgi:hypothetical protein